jgi:NADP-dependent aldehyde dehydrogenase
MSSGNPVFILPGALRKGPSALAQGLFGSFTLGGGQFCTKPGIVILAAAAQSLAFRDELKSLVEQAQPFTLLTGGIAREYDRATEERATQVSLAAEAHMLSESSTNGEAFLAQAKLFEASSREFLYELIRGTGQLSPSDEIFGPNALLISSDEIDMKLIARSFSGHLTATIFGDEDDLAANRELLDILEQKAGRLIFNGFPTGVEVSHAMVHGGPYPSTSDPRFTSVGSLAIYRFARPVCFQNFPQSQLPPELQDANPLGIRRLRDGRPE